MAILSTLVHLALEGPSVRATLEQRLEEVAQVRRFMWEEAKVRASLAIAVRVPHMSGRVFIRMRASMP